MGRHMEPDKLEELARLTFDVIFCDREEIEHDGMVYEMGSDDDRSGPHPEGPTCYTGGQTGPRQKNRPRDELVREHT